MVLGDVDLSSVHELEDGGEVLEGHVIQNDDGVLGGVLLQKSLEVGTASRQGHLVGLAALAIAGDGHVRGIQKSVCGRHGGLSWGPLMAERLVD